MSIRSERPARFPAIPEGPARPTRRGFLRASGLVAGATALCAFAPGGRAYAAAILPSRDQVIADVRRSADYWLARPPMYDDDNDWQNSTFHSGNMALYRMVRDPAYLAFTRAWGERHDYQLISDGGGKPFHADHQTAGQVYLDLYALDPQPHYIDAIVNRARAQIDSGGTGYWTWVDALHMAMPVFARLGVARTDAPYLDYLYSSYTYTKSQISRRGLYDARRGLWWRDSNFVRTGTYWSRGNGWAIAALAKVLGALPASAAHRAEYVTTLRAMAAALATVQRPDGFWNAGLTDPSSYAGPETSGTAFFTYGIAWGINHGVLDAAVYRPVVAKAWQALVTVALRSDGLLGYIQGPGAKPGDGYPWSATSTQPYGVGAFLLAGTEVAALTTPTA